MKYLSNLRARMRKNLLNGRSGQGATEYILLLVVVVGLVMVFRKPIQDAIQKKTDSLSADMDKVSNP
jgi:hypothetical protein